VASVLLIAGDPIGRRMAGTGIRYWNLARVLASEHNVTLAAPAPVDLEPSAPVRLVWPEAQADANAIAAWRARLMEDHEIVVAQDIPYYHCDPSLLASLKIVVDLYAPALLEKLEFARVDPERGVPDRSDDVRSLMRHLAIGDFFICASERQRDFWLGSLAVSGRLDMSHVQADPAFRTLIDTVPFGLPGEAPAKTGNGPRGVIPEIQPDDFVLLWNGGLWNWLDPLTAIKAVASMRDAKPAVRLVFMGTQNPLQKRTEMDMLHQAVQLASELGVKDTSVFFNDWVDYEERQNWLLEANAAISLHQATAEARFSFRTRMLDLFWCGLPSIVTEGDVMAEIVREYAVGEVVPENDDRAVAEAIRRLMNTDRGPQQQSFNTLRRTYTWESAARPLLEYCRRPNRVERSSAVDPRDEYIHHLEREFAESAKYARRLERTLEDQTRAIESSLTARTVRLVRRFVPGIR
jgi:glycosyltransferase involved in cell wall biosynthesis